MTLKHLLSHDDFFDTLRPRGCPSKYLLNKYLLNVAVYVIHETMFIA